MSYRKHLRQLCALGAGTCLITGLATPAQAAGIGAAGAGTALALPTALASIASDCATSEAPVAATGAISTRVLKSEAILGGAPSALERIRMSQTTGYAVIADAQQVPSTSADPIAELCRITPFRPDIAGFAVHTRPASSVATVLAPRPIAIPPAVPSPSAAGGFLASQRIPIGRTPFDGEWKRVSGRHLARAQVARAMGSLASSPVGRIEQVNRWANHAVRYREDSDAWRRADYWADARQTLRKGSGDCEDIAILKYQALLALGVDAGDMYLTLTRDLVRNADHAVLIVRHDSGYYLLDNATDRLLDASQANDYRPIMSFGEGQWIHGNPLRQQQAAPVYLSRNAVPNALLIGLSK